MIRSSLLAFVLLATTSAQAEMSARCQEVINKVLDHEQIGNLKTARKAETVVSRTKFTQDFYKALSARAGGKNPAGGINPTDPKELQMDKAMKHYPKLSNEQTYGVTEAYLAYKVKAGQALWIDMEKGRNPDKITRYGQSVRVVSKASEIYSLEVNRGSRSYVFRFGNDCSLSNYLEVDNGIVSREGVGIGLSSNCPSNIPASNRESMLETKFMVCKVINASKSGGGGRSNPSAPSKRTR